MPRRNFDASMVARLREDQAQAAYLRRQRLVTGPPISSGTNNILLNPQTTNYNSSSQTQAQNGLEQTFINGSLRNVYTVGCICDFTESLPVVAPPVPPEPDISEGVAVWATSQQTNLGETNSLDIKVDPFGNIFALISYTNTFTVNNYVTDATNPITVSAYGTLTAASSQTDVCLVKYDANGQVLWATSITNLNMEIGTGSLAVDGTGNVYVICTTDSDQPVIQSFVSGGSGGAINITPYGSLPKSPSGYMFVFLVKYNASGVAEWATRIDSDDGQFEAKCATDRAGNVYIGGVNRTPTIPPTEPYIDFNSQNGVSGGNVAITYYGRLEGINYMTFFLVKYNTNGIVQWVTKMVSKSSGLFKDICVAPNNMIYFVGNASNGDVDLYNKDSVVAGLINTTSFAYITYTALTYYTFIFAYDLNGNGLWGTQIGRDFGVGFLDSFIATDPNSNLYIVLNIDSICSVYSYNSVSASQLLQTAFGIITGPLDTNIIVLAKYNTNGVAQWATYLTNNDYIRGTGISTDTIGNVYISGSFDALSTLNVQSFASVTAPDINTTPAFSLLSTLPSPYTYYIVCYDSSGVAKWATNGDGDDPTSSFSQTRIACRNAQCVYLLSTYVSALALINNFDSVSGGVANVTMYNNIDNTVALQNTMIVKYGI